MANTGQANTGMLTQADIVTKSSDGIDLNDLWIEFQNVTTLFNQHKAGLISMLTFSVTSNIELVPQIGDLVFEEASEFGIPRAGNTNINYYQLAYDFKDYDLRIGYTWKFLRDANSAQIQTIHTKAFDADRELVFGKVMEAVFDNRTRLARIDGLQYNVHPFYNADGTAPPKYKGVTFDGNHSHYKWYASATLDPKNVEDAIRDLQSHGYGRDSGTRVVIFANSGTVANEIMQWRRGAIPPGAGKTLADAPKYDFIPSVDQPAQFVPNGGLLGDVPPNRWNGLVVEGSYMNAYVIDEPTIPPGYALVLATGGAGSAENVVGVREHASPEWRGLRLLPGNQMRYPLLDSYYMHGFGTGIRQRGAGIVIHFAAAAKEYVPPAQYTVGNTGYDVNNSQSQAYINTP
jgi:hypothetical protein